MTMAVSAPATVSELKARVDEWVTNYKSTPQGVVLEDVANLGDIRSVSYNAGLNALALDDRAVYFLKTPPWTTAVLARAIAQDYDEERRLNPERVGVSIGRTFIAYGKFPK